MQENKLPPGYVPLTHHSLIGISHSNGDGRSNKSRNNQSNSNNKPRSKNSSGPNRRRGLRSKPSARNQA